MVESNEIYDEIYKTRPDKWTSTERDMFAFNSLNSFLYDPPYRLLDLGCGNGHTLDFFSERWKETRYTGIDLSAVGIKLSKAKVPKGEFYVGKLDNFDPNDPIDRFGPFNAILIMGVAEHFEDIVKELKVVQKYLTSKGCVYLEAPNNLAISGRTEEGWHPSDHQTEWYLKRSTWERHIRDAGFEISERLVGGNTFNEFVWILQKAQVQDGT